MKEQAIILLAVVTLTATTPRTLASQQKPETSRTDSTSGEASPQGTTRMSEADLTQRYEDLRQVACRLTDVLLNLDEQSNAESLRNIVRLQIPSVTECVTPYTEALEEEIPGAYRVRLSITRTELVKALEDHYPALCTALAEMQTAVSTMQTTIDGTRAIIGGKQAGMEHHENREAARKRRNQATQDVEDKIKELRGKTAALHGDMLDADHRWDTDDELQ